MNQRNRPVRRCTVYAEHGDRLSQVCEMPDPPPCAPEDRVRAGATPLAQIMSNDVVCATPDLDVEALVALMVRERLGCIPVVDRRRRPIGIVTKTALVELVGVHVLTSSRAISDEVRSRTVDDVMMPMAMTLRETATVADAAKQMTREQTHHVLVVYADGRLAGVVSSHDLVTWLVDA